MLKEEVETAFVMSMQLNGGYSLCNYQGHIYDSHNNTLYKSGWYVQQIAEIAAPEKIVIDANVKGKIVLYKWKLKEGHSIDVEGIRKKQLDAVLKCQRY